MLPLAQLGRAVGRAAAGESSRRRRVDPDDPDDVAVVADDRVGVARVHVASSASVAPSTELSTSLLCRSACRRRRRSGRGRRRPTTPAPLTGVVAAVRPLVGRVEAEEVGAAADDVVLAEAAEDDVVAAVALDVVLAVGGALDRAGRPSAGRPGRRAEAVHAPASVRADRCTTGLADVTLAGPTSSGCPARRSRPSRRPGSRRRRARRGPRRCAWLPAR